MSELASEGTLGTDKLILGFDGGCLTCSNLATRIREQVGDQLEIRSLHEPQVEHWRKQALGEDAPWAPTLVEIKDGKVRAWTGWRMGLNLSRRLGPVATWQVIQILGEAKTAQNTRLADSEPPVSISRGRFIKGVAGAAVAMSVLPLTRTVSSASAAEVDGVDSPLPEILNSEEFTGERLSSTVRKVLDRADVRNVLPEGTPTEHRLASEGSKVALHDLEGDNKLLSVALVLSADRVLHFQAYNKPVQRVRSEARVLRVEDEEIVLEQISINGELVQPSSESVTSQATNCDRRCRFPYDAHLRWTCVRWRWGCVFATCYACWAAACLTGNVPGCLACILASCPYAARNCCRRRGWACVLC